MGVGIRKRENVVRPTCKALFPYSTRAHVAAGIPRRAEKRQRGMASVCTFVV